ncbi:hypothetical protein [Brochothrix thermosphacta]|uniref:Uncharacterized protein n=1 Tax=Brochothrix thermosphacta TaxID=2756 RepID=A0A2X0QBR7_BROTH|nr:hypothetical protein [Brochothrix thermosphacta]ODJ48548.1 hypothetical protein BFR34_09880 [Brochothrix thermosphacta DSM 20171 = FSL F6-1036]SOC08856.1 hypothetical protein BTH160X_140041 [Brochothrix thermosphacta]SPP25858.1 hypothetical protein BTBSAS_10152 [Brochothrix thermosphacta]
MKEETRSKNKIFGIIFIITIVIVVMAIIFAVRHVNNVKAIEDAKLEKATLIVNQLYREDRLADKVTETTLKNARTATQEVDNEQAKGSLNKQINKAERLFLQQTEILATLDSFSTDDGNSFSDGLSVTELQALKVENISNVKLQAEAIDKKAELISWVEYSDVTELSITQLFTDKKENRLAKNVSEKNLKDIREKLDDIKNDSRKKELSDKIDKADKLLAAQKKKDKKQ